MVVSVGHHCPEGESEWHAVLLETAAQPDHVPQRGSSHLAVEDGGGWSGFCSGEEVAAGIIIITTKHTALQLCLLLGLVKYL